VFDNNQRIQIEEKERNYPKRRTINDWHHAPMVSVGSLATTRKRLPSSGITLRAVREEDKATLAAKELPHLGDHHRPLADRRGYALDRSRAHVTHCEHAGLRGSKRRRN
jgi:hypothetical protein